MPISSNLVPGQKLISDIDKNAKCVFLVSDGRSSNGSQLINGINTQRSKHIQFFGGMAGDGVRYTQTYIGLNGEPKAGKVAAIAFIGEHLSFTSGHDWGWTSLGIEFKITRSNGNELIELNNQNAYDTLYDYVGKHINSDFTNDNIYFPFLLVDDSTPEGGLIRTSIAINPETKTIFYGADMPEGATVRLMKSGTMQLLDSIMTLTCNLRKDVKGNPFVFAISCVGRRIILNDMANEEFVEIREGIGSDIDCFGFYSYGEYSKSGFTNDCKMHNQSLILGLLTEG